MEHTLDQFGKEKITPHPTRTAAIFQGFILPGKCWISMQSRAVTTYKLRGRPVCWQDGAQRKIMNYNDMKKGKRNAD